MSEPILITSGMAYKVAGGSKLHKNAVYLKEFSLKPHSGKGKSQCEKDLALVQNIQITQNNLATQINGLDDVKVIYTGGADFGVITLTLLILTGGSKGKGRHPKKALETFKKHSLASKTKPINLKWGSYSFKAYLTSMRIASASLQTCTITVELSGTIAPVKNKG